jgi:hypothetical protein
MIASRGTVLLLSLFLATLTGCAATLPTMPLPDGYAVKTFVKVDMGKPFAVNRAGVFAAIVDGSVQIIESAGGPGRVIAPAPATELVFAPDGTRLAALFATADRSLLRIFDLQGKLLGETLISGRVTSIAWRSDKELLASALTIKKFSFGSEFISVLHRWDTVTPPLATPLSDVTVRPFVAKLPEADLLRSLSMALSPYGDEIAYSALKDPPLYTPYLRIAVRHLETGAERTMAETGIGSGGPIFMPDGESLLTGDARALTHQLSLADGREMNAWPTAGNRMVLSPSGSYLLLDGSLYQGGREIATFPKESIGVFLPDGSGIALSARGFLFMISGLQDPKPAGLSGDLERTLELRRLHMLGLITDKEFKSRLKKVSGREK